MFYKKINVKLHGRSEFQSTWRLFFYNLYPAGIKGKKEREKKLNPWL
jgi:hypothetical protein